MELECLNINGLSNVYEVSVFKKEFSKAVSEAWRSIPPFQRFQKKLLQDLAVLEQEKEHAIDLAQFELLEDNEKIYSIRHPETKKNVRVLYYISDDGEIILLKAFLEKNDNDYRLAIRSAKNRIKWLLSD
ncbi:type II toxin-antitoxin system RelE/ParE family toxin [Butyrivibrio sp. WCD3002]|uniref:type II toxin-antitoxin system RelE/ParE family toxin n=1 Tax=Butyrivibrio sp. WCD3002 TaxID=1280676 RepID=UPI000479F38D|nr:type II toxin-antitoxin system RelE/ParE family toxin [Butyrivibrio sp. WCD3002]